MGQGPAECIECMRCDQCSMLNRAITTRYGFHDHQRQQQLQLQYVRRPPNRRNLCDGGGLRSSCPSLAICRTKYTSFGCSIFILHLICKYNHYFMTIYHTFIQPFLHSLALRTLFIFLIFSSTFSWKLILKVWKERWMYSSLCVCFCCLLNDHIRLFPLLT